MTLKDKNFSNILAPVSLGELIDKITILEIKQVHMTDIQLKNVDKELKLLKNILQDHHTHFPLDINNTTFALKIVHVS